MTLGEQKSVGTWLGCHVCRLAAGNLSLVGVGVNVRWDNT